jgi:hypothetical protein
VRKLTPTFRPHPSDTAACGTEGVDRHQCVGARRVHGSTESCSTDIEQTRAGQTCHRPVPSLFSGAEAVSIVVQWWEAGRTDNSHAAPAIAYASRP